MNDKAGGRKLAPARQWFADSGGHKIFIWGYLPAISVFIWDAFQQKWFLSAIPFAVIPAVAITIYFINLRIFNRETEGLPAPIAIPLVPPQPPPSSYAYIGGPLTLKARGNEVKHLSWMLRNHQIKGHWMVSWPFGRLWEPFHVVKIFRYEHRPVLSGDPDRELNLDALYAEWKELKFWAAAERVKPRRKARV